MPGKIFLSYARADAGFAIQLGRDLGLAGVHLWIDKLAIAPGEPWDRAVEEALESASTILVILSPEGVSSRSVMDEVSYALGENRRTVPVLYRSCKIPLQLRRLQYIDFTSDYATGVSELIRVLSTSPRFTQLGTARVKEELGDEAIAQDTGRPREQPPGKAQQVTKSLDGTAAKQILLQLVGMWSGIVTTWLADLYLGSVYLAAGGYVPAYMKGIMLTSGLLGILWGVLFLQGIRIGSNGKRRGVKSEVILGWVISPANFLWYLLYVSPHIVSPARGRSYPMFVILAGLSALIGTVLGVRSVHRREN